MEGIAWLVICVGMMVAESLGWIDDEEDGP